LLLLDLAPFRLDSIAFLASLQSLVADVGGLVASPLFVIILELVLLANCLDLRIGLFQVVKLALAHLEWSRVHLVLFIADFVDQVFVIIALFDFKESRFVIKDFLGMIEVQVEREALGLGFRGVDPVLQR